MFFTVLFWSGSSKPNPKTSFKIGINFCWYFLSKILQIVQMELDLAFIKSGSAIILGSVRIRNADLNGTITSWNF